MLVDTSAWVEFLRATGSPAHLAVRELLRADAPILTCDPVVLEVLAGGRSPAHVRELQGLLARARRVRTTDADWESAAQLYRIARSQGITIRKLFDCLIAAVALRAGVPVLHSDVDFDAIAQASSLVARRG